MNVCNKGLLEVRKWWVHFGTSRNPAHLTTDYMDLAIRRETGFPVTNLVNNNYHLLRTSLNNKSPVNGNYLCQILYDLYSENTEHRSYRIWHNNTECARFCINPHLKSSSQPFCHMLRTRKIKMCDLSNVMRPARGGAGIWVQADFGACAPHHCLPQEPSAWRWS